MSVEQIEALIKLLEKSNLTTLEVSEGETKIKLERTQNTKGEISADISNVSVSNGSTSETAISSAVPQNAKEITAPMVGVFYSAASPDSEAFVEVGQTVQKGDTLCIIEAMKLMNEIAADKSGEILEICVKSGDIVEFGQPLFRIA